jgi:hypothetical protein
MILARFGMPDPDAVREAREAERAAARAAKAAAPLAPRLGLPGGVR